MYYHGYKFRTKKIDEMKKTCDSGISVVFAVTNISSRTDIHPQQSKNRYYGILDDILACDFNLFKIVLFIVKWFRLRLNQNDLDRTVIEHDSGFTMINTRSFEPVGDEPYVLPSQCDQVFYFDVPHKLAWSFVGRHDPRGRMVKYNVIEEEDIEEAQEEVNDHQEWQLPSDEQEEDGDDFGHADDTGDNNDDDVDGNHDHGDEDGDDHGDDGHDDDGDEDDGDGDEDGGGDDDDQSDKYDDGDDDDDDDDDMDEVHDDQWNVQVGSMSNFLSKPYVHI